HECHGPRVHLIRITYWTCSHYAVPDTVTVIVESVSVYQPQRVSQLVRHEKVARRCAIGQTVTRLGRSKGYRSGSVLRHRFGILADGLSKRLGRRSKAAYLVRFGASEEDED